MKGEAIKRPLCILLCALLLLFAGCQKGDAAPNAAPVTPVMGEIALVDGLMQNSLRYMESIHYQNGKVYYTVVNQTSADMTLAARPTVEKWVADTWIRFPLHISDDTSTTVNAAAFSATKHSFTVNYNNEELPGRYRLVFGYELRCRDANGNTVLLRDHDHVYLVGYLTIGEEHAPSSPSDFHFVSDLRQHKRVTVSLTAAKASPPYRYVYQIKNGSDQVLTVDWGSISLTRFNGKEHGQFEAVYGLPRGPEEQGPLPPQGELSTAFALNIPGDPTDKYELADGRYCLAFDCYFEKTLDFFSACVLFDIENGQLTLPP